MEIAARQSFKAALSDVFRRHKFALYVTAGLGFAYTPLLTAAVGYGYYAYETYTIQQAYRASAEAQQKWGECLHKNPDDPACDALSDRAVALKKELDKKYGRPLRLSPIPSLNPPNR